MMLSCEERGGCRGGSSAHQQLPRESLDHGTSFTDASPTQSWPAGVSPRTFGGLSSADGLFVGRARTAASCLGRLVVCASPVSPSPPIARRRSLVVPLLARLARRSTVAVVSLRRQRCASRRRQTWSSRCLPPRLRFLPLFLPLANPPRAAPGVSPRVDSSLSAAASTVSGFAAPPLPSPSPSSPSPRFHRASELGEQAQSPVRAL